MLYNRRGRQRDLYEDIYSVGQAAAAAGLIVLPVTVGRVFHRGYEGVMTLTGAGEKRPEKEGPQQTHMSKMFGAKKVRYDASTWKAGSPLEIEAPIPDEEEQKDDPMDIDHPEFMDLLEDPVDPRVLDLGGSKKSQDISMAKGYTTVIKSHTEFGSSCSDKNSVYIGIGPRMQTVYDNICISIVKALFEEAGIWGSPDQATPGTFKVTCNYFTGTSGDATATFTTAPIAGDSYLVIAGKFATALRAAFSSDDIRQIQQLVLLEGTVAISRIDPVSLKIKIMQDATLMMQNQTLSRTLDGDALSTSSNPLYARVYRTKGNFWQQKSEQRSPTYINMSTYTYPVLMFSGTNQFLTADRSIDNKFVNSSMSGGSVLSPGGIAKLRAGFEESHTLPKWMEMLSEEFVGPNTDGAFQIGHSKLCAFERQVHSVALETPILVGWECNFKEIVSYRIDKKNRYSTKYSEDFTYAPIVGP